MKKYKMYEGYCEYCGKYFISSDRRTRFCSRECGYNNRRMLKNQNVQNLRLHRIYNGMKSRCYHPSAKDYKHYGAKGIKVCQEWLNSFLNFYEWALSHGYEDSLTIDRINVNKDYCPDNCRWVDLNTQNNNRTYNVLLTYKSETHTIAQWSKITGLSYFLIWNRYKKGLSLEDIFKEMNYDM